MYCVCLAPVEARREGIGSPGTGVTDGCESSCGCWELNPGFSGRVVPLAPHGLFLVAILLPSGPEGSSCLGRAGAQPLRLQAGSGAGWLESGGRVS